MRDADPEGVIFRALDRGVRLAKYLRKEKP